MTDEMTKPNGWTGGEWEVRDVDGHLHIHAPDTHQHGFRLEMRIASDIGGYRTQREDGSWDDSQVIANAQLLASSKSLYEALAELLVAYEDPGNEGHTYDDTVAKARAALSAAKGERDGCD